MNIKRITLTTLAGALSMWLVAGLWHEVIMAHFYASETHATHEGRGLILLACIILSGLMVYLYAHMNHQGRPVVDGLKFGIIIGLLWVFPHELAMVGAHGGSIAYVLKNAAWHMVEQGIGGIVISLVYAKYKES